MKRTLFPILSAIVLVMVALPVAMPTPVLADTLTLRPDSVGDIAELIGSGGGPNWDKVDEASPDDGITYVYTSATNYELDLYNIEDHGVGSGAISSITVYARCYWAGNYEPDQESIKIIIKSGTGSTAEILILSCSARTPSTSAVDIFSALLRTMSLTLPTQWKYPLSSL